MLDTSKSSAMLTTCFLFLFVLLSRPTFVAADCSRIEFCDCDSRPNAVICNGNSGTQSDNTYLPSLSLLPPMEEYVFLNFKQIQANAFESLTFPFNKSISIRLINITIIHSEAFSASMMIPINSTLSIDIEHPSNLSSITLRPNAFNHVHIDRLRFSNVNNFNGRLTFDTACFGRHLHINELILQQSDLTGFLSSERNLAVVKRLSIRECPSFTQLTEKSLPSFLSTSDSLDISGTGLQLINTHTFKAWSLVLKELTIRNNPNFKTLASSTIDGVFMQLSKLDFSNNSIESIDSDYDWFTFSSAEHLVIKQQRQLDVFLKTNFLKTLTRLRTIDFSESYIGDDNDELIENYVPSMRNLVSMNVSFTNLTSTMVIDLLTRLSHSANQTIQVSLLNHTLNDSDFCSYFTIFNKAPNLLHLELDETHECNCIVDLFYQDEYVQIVTNDSLQRPACLRDRRRARCDLQAQLTASKCSVAKPNSDGSENNDRNIGNYAFVGVMVGLGVVLLVLLALGTGVAYRARQNRRPTILNMEEPIENPLTVIIEERFRNSQ